MQGINSSPIPKKAELWQVSIYSGASTDNPLTCFASLSKYVRYMQGSNSSPILEKDELLLSLIPIAFNEDLEGEIQTFNIFIEKENSLQVIWVSILASFRLFGETEGIAKCYFAEFKTLDKFMADNTTLPVVDFYSETIVDLLKYNVKINANLEKHRNIEIDIMDPTTDCTDKEVGQSHSQPGTDPNGQVET